MLSLEEIILATKELHIAELRLLEDLILSLRMKKQKELDAKFRHLIEE